MTVHPPSTSERRARIAVLRRIPEVALEVLRSVGDVRAHPSDDAASPEQRDELLAGAEAAVTLLTDRVDAAFLDAAPTLRVVANVAVGYDNVDLDACRVRGITVTNTPGVLTDATADLTMGMILATTRRLVEGDRLIRSGTPWRWGMFMMLGTGLQGRRLGIVGMGAIGQAVAGRARAFGMDVVYHNRRRLDPEVEARYGARRVDLDELLDTSDVVSLHCPATPETHHLVDAEALARMRPTAHLVNTARGTVVDEAALAAALADGTIAGAALDVFEHEPQVHPGLLGQERVVLVPHLGSATEETRAAMALTAARNVEAVLSGRPAPNPVVAP